MIEGITKRFELGGTQLTDEEKCAAAAVYLAGLGYLATYFESDVFMQLEVVPPGGEVDMLAFVDMGLRRVSLIAPDTQLHRYDVGSDGFVRRNDTRRRSAMDEHVPDSERFSGRPIARFAQLRSQEKQDEKLGLNNQPVDAEEVTGLFTMLGHGRRIP
jgi:hypothetical protein